MSGTAINHFFNQKPPVEQVVHTGGVGLYNIEVEQYLYNFIVMEKGSAPSSDLISHLSMPPQRVEFERDWRRDSIRSSRSNDGDSVDGGKESDKPRGRAMTMDMLQIRSRVGTLISSFIPSRKRRESPSNKRRFSVNKKQPSPVFPRRCVIEIQDNYSKICTPQGTLERKPNGGTDSKLVESVEKKEEGSKSVSNSPQLTTTSNRKLGHRRARSSDQVIDLDLSDIDLSLKDCVTSSPNRLMSPIDWEAIGSNRTDEVDSKVHA